jgi:hypothetical protein
VRVLVACEISGRVRDAFRLRGHDAWSCDILHSDHPFHITGDALPLLEQDWDLLIAHPPCTHTCVSGNAHYAGTKERQKGIEFFSKFLNANVPRICVEHPVSVVSSVIRPPDQYIQPWQFGHPESKKTGLWLKNLPKLTPTNVLNRPECGYWDNQTPSGQNKIAPSPDRGHIRSQTYLGIADAMAEQWSKLE